MRSEPQSLALPDHRCAACGARTWADLRAPDIAQSLREVERREIGLRAAIPRAALGVVVGVGVGAFAGVAFITGAAIIPVMIAFAVVIHHADRLFAGLRTPRRSAHRWHAPSRTIRRGETIGRGQVHASTPLRSPLRSPLTDREVVAWRVEVRYPGDRGDAFALVEQQCARLSVEGVALESEATIATAAVRVRVLGAAARQYLISRGIDPTDTLEIHERVVTDGARVEVLGDRHTRSVVLVDA